MAQQQEQHQQQQEWVDRDATHLVHPLHNPAAHASARVWTGEKGPT